MALIRNTFLEGTSKTRCPFIPGTTLSRILFLAIDWKQSFNLIRKDIFGGAINPWQRCTSLLVYKYTALKTIDGLLANLSIVENCEVNNILRGTAFFAMHLLLSSISVPI